MYVVLKRIPHWLQVINERDILGTQVIPRNDELALLYEKIKIQQSTLNIGEVQYAQRLEDIRILKLKKMRRERATPPRVCPTWMTSGKTISTIMYVCNMLPSVYACAGESCTTYNVSCWGREHGVRPGRGTGEPMNIHRWRKLEVNRFYCYIEWWGQIKLSPGKWSKYIWNGSEDPYTAEEADPEDWRGIINMYAW